MGHGGEETVAHSHSLGLSESQSQIPGSHRIGSSVAGLSESAMRRQPHASTWSGLIFVCFIILN